MLSNYIEELLKSGYVLSCRYDDFINAIEIELTRGDKHASTKFSLVDLHRDVYSSRMELKHGIDRMRYSIEKGE